MISLRFPGYGKRCRTYLMMLIAVIDVEPPELVATFLGETIILNVANLALAVGPSDGAVTGASC